MAEMGTTLGLGWTGEERRNSKRVLQRKLILCNALAGESFLGAQPQRIKRGGTVVTVFLGFNAGSPIWPWPSRDRETIPQGPEIPEV